MDEILKAALAYFEMSSNDLKAGVVGFLGKLEQCTDGTVGQFEEFLKERGRDQPLSPSILKELGKKKEDHLGFNDLLVLMYIVWSGRPCCDHCQAFLKGLYFTCAICFHKEEKPFTLCLDCIRKQKTCARGHSLFVDNYALLQSKSKAHELQLKEKPQGERRVPMIPTEKKIQLHDFFRHLEESYFSEKKRLNPGHMLATVDFSFHYEGSCSIM